MKRSQGSEESEQIVQKVGGMVEAISHFIHLSVFLLTYKTVPGS